MNRDEHEAQRFLDAMLQDTPGFDPFFCREHGKVLIAHGGDAACPICGKSFTEPRESASRYITRQHRLRRLGILRNHLEG